MIPILYNAVTEGTVPNNYGIGSLTDCLSCEVTEERNGSYELTLSYAVGGIHADEIKPNRIIKAKPNFTDNPQLFRIYKVGKAMNGKFEVNAQHISYDLSGKVLPAGISAPNASSAVYTIMNRGGGNFTITTDISSLSVFKTDVPASTRSWFGGKEGSLLDVYGGEWKYDNFACSLLASRGSDRGVTIRYGKNLTELSQELSIENLVTAVIPYAVNPDDDTVTTGTEKSTGLVLNVDRKIAVDFSDNVDFQSSTPVSTQLSTLVTSYVNSNHSSFVDMKNSITLNFAQTGELKERVDLCDTVQIYFEALGITASAKCVSATWDVLGERYVSNTFGNAVAKISDTIAQVEKKITVVPTKNEVAKSISEATQMITGNLGGYVVFHDSDNDGEPDEILIMDTPDINTATKVWRWNKNGLGYSSTGYSGTFGTAITADGKIVADYIATGTLNASQANIININASNITTGTISDANNRSSINMTTGEATLYNFTARGFTAKNVLGTKILADITTDLDSGRLRVYKQDETVGAVLGNAWLHFYKGGEIRLQNSSGKEIVNLQQYSNSGELLLKNSAGNVRAILYASDSVGSAFQLDDTSGSAPIVMFGSTGNIQCVSLTQTSSRKTKDNIKPIEDSGKILDLQAVSFDFKDKVKGINKRGFIAEDVSEILPNLVTPEEGNKPASINYIEMIPYLQDVIKKQEERIKVLEEKITKLGG